MRLSATSPASASGPCSTTRARISLLRGDLHICFARIPRTRYAAGALLALGLVPGAAAAVFSPQSPADGAVIPTSQAISLQWIAPGDAGSYTFTLSGPGVSVSAPYSCPNAGSPGPCPSTYTRAPLPAGSYTWSVAGVSRGFTVQDTSSPATSSTTTATTTVATTSRAAKVSPASQLEATLVGGYVPHGNVRVGPIVRAVCIGGPKRFVCSARARNATRLFSIRIVPASRGRVGFVWLGWVG